MKRAHVRTRIAVHVCRPFHALLRPALGDKRMQLVEGGAALKTGTGGGGSGGSVGGCPGTAANDRFNCGACGNVCDLVVLSPAGSSPVMIAIDATRVYWTDGDGAVKKVPLGGGNVTTLAWASLRRASPSTPRASIGRTLAQTGWTAR